MSYTIKADYKSMYYTLFRNVHLAIAEIDEKNYAEAKRILIKAHEKCEEIFIDTYEEQIINDGKDEIW